LKSGLHVAGGVIVINLLVVKLFNRTYLYWRSEIQLGLDCCEFDCWITAKSAKVSAEADPFGEVSIGCSTTTEASLVVARFRCAGATHPLNSRRPRACSTGALSSACWIATPQSN